MPTIALATTRSRLNFIPLRIRSCEFNFILDTGAEFSLLSLDLATNLNLQNEYKVVHQMLMHGVNGASKENVYKVNFRLLGKSLHHISVVDFTPLAKDVGVRIGGLLGQDLLKQFDVVEISNLRKQVSFHG